MSTYDYQFGPQTDAERAANDAVYRTALALINRPLTWQQQREVDQLTARALGLLKYERKRERGRP